jgi:hypothetical protein
MTLDASGNLLVGGTSNNGYKTIITSNAGGSVTNNLALHNSNNFSGTGTGSRLLFKLSNFEDSFESNKFASIEGLALTNFNEDTALVFRTQNNGNRGNLPLERMRLDNVGNLLVGTTGTVYSGKIGVSFDGNGGAGSQGIALIDTNASLSGDYALFVNSSGNVAGRITHNGTTTVAYTTSSDYRLKEDIHPMTGALAKVSALKPVTYKWKDDQSASEGFIAHELAEVCPQAVVGTKDAVDEDGNPKYQGIDTSFLVATLTAALQEAHSLIKDLQTRVAQLEAK